MKKVLLPAIIFLALLASCGKDDKQASQNILAKVVTKEGSDSLVTTFTYDAQNRFVGENSVDNSSGDQSSRAITRDNNGRVTRVTDSETESGTAPTSFFSDFIYLGATDTKLRNSVFNFTEQGVTIKDSGAYTYNGAQVTKTAHYWSIPTTTPALIYYYEYSYDARGNMTQVKYYETATPNVPADLLYTVTFTYDDKINPIYSKDDALVEYIGNQYVSPNNITGITFVDANDPTGNFSAAVTYEYRPDGRPTKNTTTIGGTSSVSEYTYRN